MSEFCAQWYTLLRTHFHSGDLPLKPCKQSNNQTQNQYRVPVRLHTDVFPTFQEHAHAKNIINVYINYNFSRSPQIDSTRMVYFNSVWEHHMRCTNSCSESNGLGRVKIWVFWTVKDPISLKHDFFHTLAFHNSSGYTTNQRRYPS